MRWRHAAPAVLVSTWLALAATACGSSGSTSAGPSTSPLASRSASASPSAASSASPSASPSTSPRQGTHSPSPSSHPSPDPSAAPPATCRPSQFRATLTDEQGGVGHIGEVLVLRNRSTAACTVHGYVGLQMLTAAKAPLRTTVVWGSGYLYSDPGPVTIVVAPGAAVSGGLEWDHIPGPGDGSQCPTSSYLEITPPNDVSFLVIPAAIQACLHGRITVTALQKGPSGPT